jgi:hypothetical protein
MHKAFVALALMLASIATLAHSQTAPQPSAPSQQELAPTPKLNLTLEQGHTIKEFIKDMKADSTSAKAPAVGDPVPEGISPRPLPSEVGQKVPQIKAHKFFLTAQEIVIVDPKDNKVAEVIKLEAE